MFKSDMTSMILYRILQIARPTEEIVRSGVDAGGWVNGLCLSSKEILYSKCKHHQYLGPAMKMVKLHLLNYTGHNLP
jgi:hypothetical protein